MVVSCSVLIDANILALWIVGQVSEDQIPRCRRTRHYSVSDYRILMAFLDRYTNIITTPNVATETSNLLGALSGRYQEEARKILAIGVGIWEERYITSIEASRDSDYIRLGMSDAAILLAAKDGIDVLTDDLDLYLSLARRNVPVKNFTHLRSFQWAGINS